MINLLIVISLLLYAYFLVGRKIGKYFSELFWGLFFSCVGAVFGVLIALALL